MEKEVKVRAGTSEICVLLKMYQKGQLGRFPVSDVRLKAGLAFMNDYRRSLFSHRTTTDYAGLQVAAGRGRNGADGVDGLRCDAADRYLRALKYIEPFGVYARHFLRDERNVADFLERYPVLDKGSKRTYKTVYRAINKMLDGLAAFYAGEKR